MSECINPFYDRYQSGFFTQSADVCVKLSDSVAFTLTQLTTPRQFDELRRDDSIFEQLAELGGRDDLGHVELCRYAQYLVYRGRHEEARNVVEAAEAVEQSPLLEAIKFMLYAESSDHTALARATEAFQVRGHSGTSLDMEGFSLGFEGCAYYFALVRGDFYQSYAYLHRAESLALFLELEYRLGVIRSKIEATANMAGDVVPLEPLKHDKSGMANQYAARARFLTYLKRGDIEEIRKLTRKKFVTLKEYQLAEATREYHLSLLGEGSVLKAVNLITESMPEDPDSRLYWSLIMLQLFVTIGDAGGRANPERIFQVLQTSLGEVEQIQASAALIANLYPLGLVLASKLEKRLVGPARQVTVLWDKTPRDGLRRDGKKISSVTKPVREALILDEMLATHHHYRDAIRKPGGHWQNKHRFETSLKKAGVSRPELVTVGGVYRGLIRLGKGINQPKLIKEARLLRQQSIHLKLHLSHGDLELL